MFFWNHLRRLYVTEWDMAENLRDSDIAVERMKSRKLRMTNHHYSMDSDLANGIRVLECWILVSNLHAYELNSTICRTPLGRTKGSGQCWTTSIERKVHCYENHEHMKIFWWEPPSSSTSFELEQTISYSDVLSIQPMFCCTYIPLTVLKI